MSDDNLDSALVGVSVVFDGIDAGMSPWEKYAQVLLQANEFFFID